MLKGINNIAHSYLIRQLPVATAFINKKFEVLYASDKWISDHELDPSKVFGNRIDSLFTEFSEQWKSTLGDCLSGKVDKIDVDYNLDTNANNKCFEWSYNPWYDERENIIGLIVCTEDVTESRRNQHEMSRLRSFLKIVAEVSKIGSWEYNINDEKFTWSTMTRDILEVDDDFIPTIDSGVDFFKDGHSKNTIAMAVHEAINNGTPWNEKLQLITAKGNEIWVKAAGLPIFEGKRLIGLTGTFQNIDNQVRSEVKTKESEELLRTLIDNLPMNVFIKDAESKKILVNKSECDYLGVKSADELLGKDDFELYDEEIAQISRDEDLRVMDTLTPIIGKETINRKKNGEITTFLTSKIPLIASNGKANRLVGISLDISDIKQKEEELRDLISVTSQQNKKLVNFAHIVSHNLRSHTANFSMLLDFLVNEKEEDEKENIIKMLTEASDNLLETLDNLNDVVVINTNVNLEKRTVNLNEKINIVQQNLMGFLLNNNATIINNISNDTEIKVVPAYIDSILMNFITNAVKYKNPEKDPLIKLDATSENSYTIISIEDNGLGIDLDKYGDKLFGMYKTFHNHSDSRGIGLYITKNQIEAMNGKVTVSSEVGIGTTFKIYLHEKD